MGYNTGVIAYVVWFLYSSGVIAYVVEDTCPLWIVLSRLHGCFIVLSL